MTDDLLRELGILVAEGEFCDLTATKLSDGRPGIVKSAKEVGYNENVAREARTLERFAQMKPDYRPFFPELVEHSPELMTSSGKTTKAGNVLVRLEGFYNLEQVREAYPDGVHPLDAVWMWRKLLVALGAAHRMDVLHAATLPPHVMIHPDEHGLVLVDWCYSKRFKEFLFDSSLEYISWYGPEIRPGSTFTESTDIWLAGKTMVYLLGGDPLTMDMPDVVPEQMQQFLETCCMESPKARPQDAWELLREFDGLLERLGEPYHPRRFRAFTMTPEKEKEGS